MRKLVYLGLVMATFLLTPLVSAAPDFSITASPTSFTISAGNVGTSTITLRSNGFSGAVGLSSALTDNDPTITTSLNPTSVPLSQGGSGQSILTVSTTPFTSLGTHIVTVTGSSGSTSHSVSIPFVVQSGTVGAIASAAHSTGLTPIALAFISLGATLSVGFGIRSLKAFTTKRNNL